MTTTTILSLILSALSFLGSLVALWFASSNRRAHAEIRNFAPALLDAMRALDSSSRLNVRVTNPREPPPATSIPGDGACPS